MGVVIKFGNWKRRGGTGISPQGVRDIELIQPTDQERKELQVGDRVVIIKQLTLSDFSMGMVLYRDSLVAILSPEPQKKGLPEKIDFLESKSHENMTTDDFLAEKINEVIDYLKDKEAAK